MGSVHSCVPHRACPCPEGYRAENENSGSVLAAGKAVAILTPPSTPSAVLGSHNRGLHDRCYHPQLPMPACQLPDKACPSKTQRNKACRTHPQATSACGCRGSAPVFRCPTDVR